MPADGIMACGRVKGTIRAVRVKLQSGGAVEGDIFDLYAAVDNRWDQRILT